MGQRLLWLLPALLACLAYQSERATVLNIGTADNSTIRGFYQPERNQQEAYRWSRPQATVAIPALYRPSIVELRGAVAPNGAQVDVALGQNVAAALPINTTGMTQIRRYELLAPAEGAGRDQSQISIVARAPSSSIEQRPLRLMLTSLAIQPTDAGLRLPPLQALLLLVIGPLFVYSFLRLCKLPQPLATALSLTLGSLAGVLWGWWALVPHTLFLNYLGVATLFCGVAGAAGVAAAHQAQMRATVGAAYAAAWSRLSMQLNRLMDTLLHNFLLLITLVALGGYAAVYAYHLAGTPLRSDGMGYYAYLPALLIYHDPSLHTFGAAVFGGDIPGWTGIQQYPATGRYLNKYSVGVAIMLLPFFGLAHLLTLAGGYPADGVSFFYQYVIGMGGIFYMVLGMFFLKRTLERHFSPGVTLATLICILFGSNLYHYATYDSSFSHAFSFCLIALLLYFLPRWYAQPSYTHSILLALICGMIVLVRNPNLVVLIVVPLFGITSIASARSRLAFFTAQWPKLLLMAGIGLIVLLPQFALWKYATGQWIVQSYQREGFSFASPKIVEVLFSVRKGLFFWSPILIFSVLGLPALARRARDYALPAFVFLPLMVYIVASWWDWAYGGSYGHRAFTDSLALFALAMAAFYASLQHSLSKMLAAAVATCCVLLSLFQMVQYWQGIIPFDRTTWELYQQIFLQL